MPEPIPEQILANIATTITSIDASASGSPYFFTIGVNQFLRADSLVVEIENGPFPFVTLTGTVVNVESSHTQANYDHVNERVRFSVMGALETQTNVQRDLHRLSHDIRTALWADPTRGGLARLTWVESVEFFYSPTVEGHAQCFVEGFVEFESKLSDLTSTIP